MRKSKRYDPVKSGVTVHGRERANNPFSQVIDGFKGRDSLGVDGFGRVTVSVYGLERRQL